MQRIDLLAVAAQHPCTAVLVTHDIEEAVLLADRIIILEHGTIRDEFAVDLPRPRDRADARFQQLATRVLERVLRPSSADDGPTSAVLTLLRNYPRLRMPDKERQLCV